MERLEALRKLLDGARVALAGVVGLLAVLAEQADVLGLPPGVKGAIVGAVALAGQWGIRTRTTPHDDLDPSQIPELADTPEFQAVAAEPAPPAAVASEVPAIAQAPPRGELTEPPPNPGE